MRNISAIAGNLMAKHLTVCERKSTYPSEDIAKSATVTHSMLDVLGLVRRLEEPITTTVNEIMEIDSDDDKNSDIQSKQPVKKTGKTNKVQEAVELRKDFGNEERNNATIDKLDQDSENSLNGERNDTVNEIIEDIDNNEECIPFKIVSGSQVSDCQKVEIALERSGKKKKKTEDEEKADESSGRPVDINKDNDNIDHMDVSHVETPCEGSLRLEDKEVGDDLNSNQYQGSKEVDVLDAEKENLVESEDPNNHNNANVKDNDVNDKNTYESMEVDCNSTVKDMSDNDSKQNETSDVEEMVQ